jgi:hypothetical protein
VKFVFKRMHTHPVSKTAFFSVGILLENGEIHVIESDNPSDYSSWFIDKKKKKIAIPGEVQTCSNDPVQFKCNLFLSL